MSAAAREKDLKEKEKEAIEKCKQLEDRKESAGGSVIPKASMTLVKSDEKSKDKEMNSPDKLKYQSE